MVLATMPPGVQITRHTLRPPRRAGTMKDEAADHVNITDSFTWHDGAARVSFKGNEIPFGIGVVPILHLARTRWCLGDGVTLVQPNIMKWSTQEQEGMLLIRTRVHLRREDGRLAHHRMKQWTWYSGCRRTCRPFLAGGFRLHQML